MNELRTQGRQAVNGAGDGALALHVYSIDRLCNEHEDNAWDTPYKTI